MSRLPGGPMAARPLHFMFVADSSPSMNDNGRIQALNFAIREALPHMLDVARGNPNASVFVRAMEFSTGARWLHAEPQPLEGFRWRDLQTSGSSTDMGCALSLLARALEMGPMPRRALPPVLVLVSDGSPTDDFAAGLRALRAQPWGMKAVRLAVAIGDDARLDCLQEFIGHPELQPLRANNTDQLVKYIRWASTAVLQAASAPASQPLGLAPGVNVPVPPPPDVLTDVQQVF